MQDIPGQSKQLLFIQGLCFIEFVWSSFVSSDFGVWFRRRLAYVNQRANLEKYTILRYEIHTEYGYGGLIGLFNYANQSHFA